MRPFDNATLPPPRRSTRTPMTTERRGVGVSRFRSRERTLTLPSRQLENSWICAPRPGRLSTSLPGRGLYRFPLGVAVVGRGILVERVPVAPFAALGLFSLTLARRR